MQINFSPQNYITECIFFYMDVSKKIQDIARIFSHKVKKVLYILKIDQGKSLISQENIVKHDY